MSDNKKTTKKNAATNAATKTTKANANTKSASETPPKAETPSSASAALAAGTDARTANTVSDAQATPSTLNAEPSAEPELLRLPRGAFLALRKSGGLKFSTREVVVYPDGRVAYDARGVPQKDYNRLRRVLNDGQIMSLRKLLDQTNFWHTESGDASLRMASGTGEVREDASGKQNADAFAYEIAAHHGQRSNSIQVFDGSIPENLKPLLERLMPLLPEE